MLLSLSVACSAGSLTRRFIFELKQDSDSLKQNFSINRDWHTLSVDLSDIAQIDDYAERDLAPDKKRHRRFNYGIQKTIIESISWQWLYATNLLIAYELILTTKQFPTSDTPYLWLPTEVVATVGWFLKNYCAPDTQLFNPIEQQVNQDHPFATIITVFGSGNNPLQYQSSESFSQQAPQATLPPTSSLIRPLNNDYSGGNGGYQQQQHTLGLNCFIHPCYGFCRFRPPSGSSGPAERPLNTSESSGSHLATGQCLSCVGHYDPANATKLRQNPLFKTLNDLSDIQLPFDSDPLIDGIDAHLTDSIQNAIEAIGSLDDDVPMLMHLSSIADNFEAIDGSLDPESLLKEDEVAFTLNHSETQQTTSKSSHLDQSQPQLFRAGAVQAKADSGQRTCAVSAVGKDGQSRACRKVCNNAQALFDHKIKDHGKQQICEVIVVGEDRQQRPCGKVCRNAIALMIQKRQEHSGQKVCEVIVAGEHGQQRPCGRVYKSAASLSSHKSGYHSGIQTCVEIKVGSDGQWRPCGKVCKDAQALSSHKINIHGKQRTCEMIVVREDGQQRPCGKVYRNAQALSNHKRRDHTGQQVHSGQKVCEVIVVGEHGQQRPCGRVYKSAASLSSHKSGYHSGIQTCVEIKVGADGQRRPCGKVCKDAQALSNHKINIHGKQRTCEMIVVREDGQQRPCGKVFRNAKVLSNHKRRDHTGQQAHSGQKVCEVIVVGEHGQQRPCGRVYKSAASLSSHKRGYHSGIQTCVEIKVGADGQRRPCGRVCKDAQALSNHKRKHRKRKPADLDEDDKLSAPADKVNKCDYLRN